MKHFKPLLIVLLLAGCLNGMNKPFSISPHQPGIFLETVICEYPQPISIDVMNVEYVQRYSDDSGEDGFKADACGNLKRLVEAYPDSKKTKYFVQPIPMVAGGGRSRACLLVEDVSDKNAFTSLWLEKKITADGKMIFGDFYADDKDNETLFVPNGKLTQTLVTIKVLNTHLRKYSTCTQVTSKTTVCNS